MVANFSASDLVGLNENNFQYLSLSVSEFLTRMHGFPKVGETFWFQIFLFCYAFLCFLFFVSCSFLCVLFFFTHKFTFGFFYVTQPPVFCKVSDSVEVVMLRLLVHKVHRTYIVDEDMVPQGVITLTDIMQFLLAA